MLGFIRVQRGRVRSALLSRVYLYKPQTTFTILLEQSVDCTYFIMYSCQIEQGDDDLMHFKWKDRTSGTVEDDLIIFPDDIDFVRVDQVSTLFKL